MKDGGKILFFEPTDAIFATGEYQTPGESTPAASTDARAILGKIIRLLSESGFQPVTQLMGYIIADDPTYLPEEGDVRALARRIGRDKLLETLLTVYMEDHPMNPKDE